MPQHREDTVTEKEAIPTALPPCHHWHTFFMSEGDFFWESSTKMNKINIFKRRSTKSPPQFIYIYLNKQKIFRKKKKAAKHTHTQSRIHSKCQASKGGAGVSCWEDAAIRRLIIKLQTCTETLLWPENTADCSEIPPSLAKKKKIVENLAVSSKSFHR